MSRFAPSRAPLFPLLCFFCRLCVSSSLLLCCSSLFLRGVHVGKLFSFSLCSTLKASRPLPSGHDRITTGFVRVFALLHVFRRGRVGFVYFLSPSSFLLLSSFRLWSLRTSHQAITPSFHLPFASPSLAWRNARSD